MLAGVAERPKKQVKRKKEVVQEDDEEEISEYQNYVLEKRKQSEEKIRSLGLVQVIQEIKKDHKQNASNKKKEKIISRYKYRKSQTQILSR
jgi:hypothetical protein